MSGRPLQVTVQEARTQLSRLIHRAQAGEEVIIARGDKPVVRLVAIDGSLLPRNLGGAPGLVEYMADDFNAETDDFGAYAPSESKSMRW